MMAGSSVVSGTGSSCQSGAKRKAICPETAARFGPWHRRKSRACETTSSSDGASSIVYKSNMAARLLMRSSGLLLIGGGLLQIPATFADPDLYDLQSLKNPVEAPDHVLYWVAYLMITVGLPGALIGQLERLACWGAAGFMLALAGSALTIAVSVIAAHVLPATVSVFGPSATFTGLLQPGGRLESLLLPVALTSLN